MCWNDQVKAAVKRKEVVWKKLFGARDEEPKKTYLDIYKEEMREVKRFIHQTMNEVNSLERRC